MSFKRLALCMLLPPVVFAQRSPFPPDRLARVRGVLDALYRMNFAAAESRCREMIAAWPDDPVGRVYLARVYWQQLLEEDRALTVYRFIQPDFFVEKPTTRITADPGAIARFQQAAAEAIAQAQASAQRRPRDPAALFLLGAAFQNEASFRLAVTREWWQAFRAGSRSERAQRELLKLDPTYADALLVTGVFHYTVGALGWNLRWIPLLLGYHGTKSQGEREIEQAAARGQIVADDARALLALLYTMDHRYDAALQKLEELGAKYPENYLTQLDIAGIRLRRGNPSAAIQIYNHVLSQANPRLERAIVYNQLGIAWRESKNYTESRKWLEASLSDPAASPRTKAQARVELARLPH